MPTPTTHTLEVPGSRLYYEVQGTGPVLMLVGHPLGAAGFAAVAPVLAEAHTVVTFDPRGFGRSEIDDPDQDAEPDLLADDACRLLEAVSQGPAHVFGSSGGAVTGLALVARHPGHVGTLVAHEPPLALLLPEAEAARAGMHEIYERIIATASARRGGDSPRSPEWAWEPGTTTRTRRPRRPKRWRPAGVSLPMASCPSPSTSRICPPCRRPPPGSSSPGGQAPRVNSRSARPPPWPDVSARRSSTSPGATPDSSTGRTTSPSPCSARCRRSPGAATAVRGANAVPGNLRRRGQTERRSERGSRRLNGVERDSTIERDLQNAIAENTELTKKVHDLQVTMSQQTALLDEIHRHVAVLSPHAGLFPPPPAGQVDQ